MLPVPNNRNRDASDTINDRLNDSVMTAYTIISSNPRNPNVMFFLREIGLAEKAGSGFDKIFTDLLKKGKQLPEPEETETSVIFCIKAEVSSEKLIELSLHYMEVPKTRPAVCIIRNCETWKGEVVRADRIAQHQSVPFTHHFGGPARLGFH